MHPVPGKCLLDGCLMGSGDIAKCFDEFTRFHHKRFFKLVSHLNHLSGGWNKQSSQHEHELSHYAKFRFQPGLLEK